MDGCVVRVDKKLLPFVIFFARSVGGRHAVPAIVRWVSYSKCSMFVKQLL